MRPAKHVTTPPHPNPLEITYLETRRQGRSTQSRHQWPSVHPSRNARKRYTEISTELPRSSTQTRHACGRNWARRDRDELLQLGARFRPRVGAFGEVSMKVRNLADLVACELNAEHLALFDDPMNESKRMFTQRIRRSIGLAVHRRWAKLLLGRCRDLVQDPRQPLLTHARQMRTTPRHTSTYIFTRPAAGVATATTARSRGLLG